MALGELDRLHRFGYGADLIQLDENGIRHALLDAALQPLGRGDE